jgi:hypothetical protein
VVAIRIGSAYWQPLLTLLSGVEASASTIRNYAAAPLICEFFASSKGYERGHWEPCPAAGAFIMERKQLLGIAQRAESQSAA